MFAVHIVSAVPFMLRNGAPAILELANGGMAFHQPQRFYEPNVDGLDRTKAPDGGRWIWRRGDVFFVFYDEEEERRFEAVCLGILDA